MEGVEKRSLFIFGIFVLFIIMFTGFSEAANVCSTSDQIILRLSNDTNAHGEEWNGAGNYTEEICYNDIFGVAGSGDRTCTGSNKIVGLSGTTNAHGEDPNLSNYATDVCYSGLDCTARTGSCLVGESLVLSLSDSTNAHMASDSSYSQNICCSIGSASGTCGDGNIQSPNDEIPPIFEECDDGNLIPGDGCNVTCGIEDHGPCEITSASWRTTSAFEGDVVYLDVVTNSLCIDGAIVTFDVFEDEAFGADPPALIDPLDTSISGTSLEGTWTAEWLDDGLLQGDPEYYFIVNIPIAGESLEAPPPFLEVEQIVPPPGCGDGVIDLGEVCDMGDLRGYSCTDFDEYTGGTLVCNSQCSGFDTSSCATYSCNNNGIRDVGESCDGSDLDGFSCADFGDFAEGTLGCDSSCNFDTSSCAFDPDCLITSASWNETEVVEGTAVSLDVVTSLCDDGSEVSFEVWEDDLSFDDHVLIEPSNAIISGDSATGTWIAEYADDGGDPEYYFYATIATAGQVFESFAPFLTVTQAPPSICGNGDLDTGESCDGSNLNGESCTSLGLSGSGLSCDPITCEFDTSTCTGYSCNNDGTKDSGEACDGTDLGGFSCTDFDDFTSGTLGCDSLCNFDTGSCTNPSIDCELISASWSETSVVEGDLVNLDIVTSGCPDGELLSFEVWESDLLNPDDHVSIEPLDRVVGGNSATGTWRAEWQGDGIDGDPEYYFEVTIVSTGKILESSDPLLDVSQSPAGDYCNSAVVICGQYYDDLSGNPTAEDACNVDLCDVSEFSVEELVNDNSFCDSADIDCFCEWDSVSNSCSSAWTIFEPPIPPGDIAICIGQMCVATTGSGPDECSTGAECDPEPTHSECINNMCMEVPGNGVSECAPIGGSCAGPVHAVCIGQMCGLESGLGPDECSVNVDCSGPETHAKCVNNMCVEISEVGVSECAIIGSGEECEDSGGFHAECVGQMCGLVSGAGANECSTDSECSSGPEAHSECVSNMCVEVSGPGVSECAPVGEGCGVIIEAHSICIGQMCGLADGAGVDECSTNAECSSQSVSHSECIGNMCVEVLGDGVSECAVIGSGEGCTIIIDPPVHSVCIGQMCGFEAGAGSNECSVDVDCSSEPVSHSECVNNMCAEVSGPGVSECAVIGSGKECTMTTDPVHAVCIGQMCGLADGAGIDECSSNVDCSSQSVSHSECVNNMCAEVSGSGVDECGIIGGSCGIISPIHSTCIGQMCGLADGAGVDECSTNAECSSQSVSHSECISNMCVEISGDGVSECSTIWGDCNIPNPVVHSICIGQMCGLAEGPGVDECSIDPDCSSQSVSHSECINNMCLEVSGFGVSECAVIGNECLVTMVDNHAVCIGQMCGLAEGPGVDECSANADCSSQSVSHAECVNNMCVEVPGDGVNSCSNLGGGCGIISPVHATCVGQMCSLESGLGPDECSANADCSSQSVSHAECVDNTCMEVSGDGVNSCNTLGESCGIISPPVHSTCIGQMCGLADGAGIDECSSNVDCSSETVAHSECIGNMCVEVSGAGVDECSIIGGSCGIISPPVHSTCIGQMCGLADGAGIDECSSNVDCSSETVAHSECISNMCVEVSGSGVDGCGIIGGSCDVIAEIHSTCIGQMCGLAEGPGVDECSTNSDCSSEPVSHAECIGNMCVEVSGDGITSCGTIGGSCNAIVDVHSTCIGQMCGLAEGPGVDECSVNADCSSEPVSHAECIGNTCVEVPGDGITSCGTLGGSCSIPSSFVCGNGVIESGEQCEPPTNFGAISSCSAFGLSDGTLICDSNCQFDTSDCIGDFGSCGNDNINIGETCDGTPSSGDWGAILSCTDFDSFKSGNLKCVNCQFDTAQCSTGTGGSGTRGKCVYIETTTGSCEDGGSLTSTWTATWVGVDPKPASCENGAKAIICPAQVQLAFFNVYNMLITLLIIAGIYGLLSLRKKED